MASHFFRFNSFQQKKPEPPKRSPENESKTDGVGEFDFRAQKVGNLRSERCSFLNSPTLSKLGAKPFNSRQQHWTTMDKFYHASARQAHQTTSQQGLKSAVRGS